MGKVLQIGISKIKGNEILNVNNIKVIKGKGIENDRNFKNENNVKKQITLIEIENINYYNQKSMTKILSKDFRRNIVTKGIKLNDLLKKEFFVGEVKLKAHDLCRPCKYLENLLLKKNIIKELINKGGLRCEILSDGNISVGDLIKT